MAKARKRKPVENSYSAAEYDNPWVSKDKFDEKYPSLRPLTDGWVNLRRSSRLDVVAGYESLSAVHDDALHQAQSGKGKERHSSGEAFDEQPIVSICEDLGSSQFAIGQAVKKSRESLRLPYDRARAELLGAINYLSAAVIVLDRANQTISLDDDDSDTYDPAAAHGKASK